MLASSNELELFKQMESVFSDSSYRIYLMFRDDEYKARRRQRIISPERHDPFAAGDQTPDARYVVE